MDAPNPLNHPAAVASDSRTAVPAYRGRLASVDALRGFDLFWILGADVLVQSLAKIRQNSVTGFVYRQFDHARWAGFHFYDLIYPLFLFLVGVSIVLSIDKARATEPKRAIVGRILRRGLVLYVFNFIYNGGFSGRWPDMRATGVLALIAVSYVIAALIYCFFAERLKLIAGIAAALLLGYWALFVFVPFPDFHLDGNTIEMLAAKAGSHSPAQIAAAVPERVAGVYDEGRNLSNYLDFRFMPGRMWNRYYENEGLLSPISASVICLMGVFAARLLKAGAIDPRRRALWLATGGAAAVVVGLIWGLEFPIVKKLWTSSFCLLTAGCSAMLLAMFYTVVDIWEWRRWCQPFVWIGSNPITLYMLAALVGFPRIADRLAGGNVKDLLNHALPGAGGAIVPLVTVLLVVLLARFLYRRGIFLRV